MKKNKIGILGGTFNPIHNGHIKLASQAYFQYNLDKILVMVSKTPPHKANMYIPSAQIRSQMVKLAIADYDYMEFSDFELQRDGFIYTADTLSLLCKQYPENQYYFIIGGDSLDYFDTWYHPEVILSKATILASGRSGLDSARIDKKIYELKQSFPYGKIYKIELPDIPFSSSGIRVLLLDKTDNSRQKVSKMLDEKVLDYIMKEAVYGAR